MKFKKNKLILQGKLFHIFFYLCIAISSQAQNLGEYVINFPVQQQTVRETVDLENIQATLSTLYPSEQYEKLSFKLLHSKQSFQTIHLTYQAYFKDIALEQMYVKLHLQDDVLRSIQSNIPSAAEWQNLNFIYQPVKDKSVCLFEEDRIIVVEKELIEIREKDLYKVNYVRTNGSYYENELKYHIDTTAYAKVFRPDPLSSAGAIYGGNYQDSYTKDTLALVIQTFSNPGGSTITTNSSNYTFNGQSFPIGAESYVNGFPNGNLSQVFESINLDGQGTILGYNTAITDNPSVYLTQIIREDYNYPSLENELEWQVIPVDFSGGVFNLANDYFIVSEFSAPITNPAFSNKDTFDFTRNQIPFEDVNAFYHLNNFRAHWLSLGFTDLASEVILVDAHGNSGADNSFFSPSSPPVLVFGQGGVDDAEDADVVVHEYGHGISHFASPNTNISHQRRSLDEGFGDYLASSYSRSITPFNTYNVFSWDGHNEFWNGRVSNSTKTAEDISDSQSIYYNGEIWAATLMDLRAILGRTISDQLAIEVMYYNLPNTTIKQAAFNLFVADTAMYNGIHTCDIFQVLRDRKFVLGTCTDFYSGIRHDFSADGAVSLINSRAFTYNQGSVTLSSDNVKLEGATVQLIDVNGKIILQQIATSDLIEISGEDLAPGIYFIDLQTKQKPYRFKILKN